MFISKTKIWDAQDNYSNYKQNKKTQEKNAIESKYPKQLKIPASEKIQNGIEEIKNQ